MLRPIGIIAVTVYFVFQSISVLWHGLIYRPLSSVVFVINIIVAVALILTSWGIFRLWEWARFLGMFVIVVEVGLTAPVFIIETKPFDISFSLLLISDIVNLFVAWYLFRSATAKRFSPMLKTV